MPELEAVPWRLVDHLLLAGLFREQYSRQSCLHPQLPSPQQQLAAQIESCLAPEHPIYLAMEEGRILGLAIPEVIAYPDGSDMPTYYPFRKGRSKALVLCGRDVHESHNTLSALIQAMDLYWENNSATGAEIIWPTDDFSIDGTLKKHHFGIDGFLAFRELKARKPVSSSDPCVCIRHARKRDEASIVDLYMEVIDVHVAHSPFARHIPAAEPRFRERLRAILGDGEASDRTSFVLVAEVKREVVAMAECWISTVSPHQDFPFKPGRYGYVNSLGVRGKVRRGGIGKILDAAVTAEFSAQNLNGSYLWYSARNPSARRFWPCVGYRPVWVAYQRRNAADRLRSYSAK